MTDIFISYTEENQQQAKLLSKALEQQGFSVWWNKDTPEGQLFNNHADEALQEARCVIVIWSQFSVSDRWINSVARESSDRGNLLPALFEDVFVPVEFREIETANLIGWKGETSDTFFQDMVKEINKLIQRSNDPEQPLQNTPVSAISTEALTEDEGEVLDDIEVSSHSISDQEEPSSSEAVLEATINKSEPEEEIESKGEIEDQEESIAAQEISLVEELRTSNEGDSPVEELVKEVNNEIDELQELPVEPVAALDPVDHIDVSQSADFEDEVDLEMEQEHVETTSVDYEPQADHENHFSEPERDYNEISEKAKSQKVLLYGGLIAAVLVVLWGIFQVLPDDKESIDQVQTIDVSPQLPAANPPPEVTEPITENTETLDWNAALETNDIAAFEAYQAKYPQGQYLTEAKEKIALLRSEETSQTTRGLVDSESPASNNVTSTTRAEAYATVAAGNFFTTKMVTKGPMRPGEPNQDFLVGERVYIWATISTPAYERVKIEWLTSDDRTITTKYVNIARDLGNGFNIHDWKQNFPGTRGQYKVRLYNSNKEKIAETAFRIN